jgi:hypothetical protein
MKDESKPFSLTTVLTTCFAFVRVHSWDLYDRAGRSTADFIGSMSRTQRIALKAIVTACLALLFFYSWTHSGPPEYFRSGKRIIPWTLPLGMALLAFFISLLGELSGKE